MTRIITEGVTQGATEISDNRTETRKRIARPATPGDFLADLMEQMGQRIKIRCFTTDASIASRLKFLHKTPWARAKVEEIYLYMLRERARKTKTAGT